MRLNWKSHSRKWRTHFETRSAYVEILEGILGSCGRGGHAYRVAQHRRGASVPAMSGALQTGRGLSLAERLPTYAYARVEKMFTYVRT